MKIKKIIDGFVKYLMKHWSAIIVTDSVLSMGLVNPFVVDKFQSIYRYPVTRGVALIWDGVYIITIIVVILLDRWIEKLDEK